MVFHRLWDPRFTAVCVAWVQALVFGSRLTAQPPIIPMLAAYGKSYENSMLSWTIRHLAFGSSSRKEKNYMFFVRTEIESKLLVSLCVWLYFLVCCLSQMDWRLFWFTVWNIGFFQPLTSFTDQDIIFPCVIDAILRINKNINLRIFKVIPNTNFFELT